MKNGNKDIIKPETEKKAGKRIIKLRRRGPVLSTTSGRRDSRILSGSAMAPFLLSHRMWW